MAVSASRWQDIHWLLDEVIRSGEPLTIEWRGHRLVIAPADEDTRTPGNRLQNLQGRPGVITGNASDLDTVTWADALRP